MAAVNDTWFINIPNVRKTDDNWTGLHENEIYLLLIW